MLLFRKKKEKVKSSALPPHLIKLQEHPDIVWVWDPKYNTIIWANNSGLTFWGVEKRSELKELFFDARHPLHAKNKEILKHTKSHRDFSLPLALRGGHQEYVCQFFAQDLPDGRDGIMVRIDADTISTDDYNQDDVLDEFHNLTEDKPSKKKKSKPAPVIEELDEDEELALLDDEDLPELELEPVKETKPTKRMLPIVEDDDDDELELQPLELIDEEDELELAQGLELLDEDEDEELDLEDNLEDDIKPIQLDDDDLSILEDEPEDVQEEIIKEAFEETELTKSLYQVPMTVTCHMNGKIFQINERARELLGLQAGNDFQNVFVEEHDRKFIIPFVNQHADASAVTLVKIAGHDIPCLIQAKRVVYNDHKLFHCGFLRITQEQYQENIKFDRIPESDYVDQSVVRVKDHDIINYASHLALFLVNKNGKILSINERATYLLGLYKDDLMGRSILAVFDNDTTIFLRNMLLEGDISDIEDGLDCRFHGRDNKMSFGYVTLRPHATKEGNFWLLLDDKTDIQELKDDISYLVSKNITTLKDEPQKFTSQVESIPEAVTIVNHELRAPLTTISAYLELLKSQPYGNIDERYLEYIDNMASASNYALDIVSELLTYSEYENAGFRQVIETVSVGEIINQIEKMFTPQAEARGLLIEVDTINAPYLRIDKNILKKILVNLVSNAVKYSDDDSVISLKAGRSKSGHVLIELSNYSHSLTAEKLEVAFKPYGRVHTNDKIIGTGLGLPLVKKMLLATRGGIAVRAETDGKIMWRIGYPTDMIVENLSQGAMNS